MSVIDKLRVKLQEPDESCNDIDPKVLKKRSQIINPEVIKLYLISTIGLIFNVVEAIGEQGDVQIISRIKSPISQMLKGKRKLEKYKSSNKEISDIIASKIVLSRLYDKDESFLSSFSQKTKAKYRQREENIDLIGSCINFISRQLEDRVFDCTNSYNLYSKPETVESDVKKIESSLMDFTNNIINYKGKKFNIKGIKRPNIEFEVIRALNDLSKEKNDESFSEQCDSIIKFLRVENSLSVEDANQNKEHTIVIDGIEYEDLNEQNENVKLAQEEFYKYMLIVLIRMRKLEYKDCKTSYIDIDNRLKSCINSIYELIKDGGFNDNIMLSDLNELSDNIARLNAILSDKLQHRVLREIMEYNADVLYKNASLLEIVENGGSKYECIVKNNGYVSDHYDMVLYIGDKKCIPIEVQTKSDNRNKIASIGSAAYGSSRGDKAINDEKQRKIALLPKALTAKQYTNSDNEHSISKCIVIDGFGKINNMNEEQRKKWVNQLKRTVPQYFTTEYNSKQGFVTVTCHSLFQCVEHYYLETNNGKDKKRIIEGLKYIKEYGLLEDETVTISISKNEYKSIINGEGLQNLINIIENKNEKNIDDNDALCL